MPNWVHRLSPDLAAAFRRFPLAIVLSGLATMLIIATHYDLLARYGVTSWSRHSPGLLLAALYAAAGSLLVESRVAPRWLSLPAAWLLPLAVAVLYPIEHVAWIDSDGLLPLGILWFSIAAVTGIGRGDDRRRQQDYFWWFCQRAVVTLVIATVAVCCVCGGIYAIGRSLDLLFGISAEDLLDNWVLPITYAFLAPVYWLAMLPKRSEISDEVLARPDFLARAGGFLGQFVLIPLLLVICAILLAYAAQGLVTRHMPNGIVGRLSGAVLVTGAITWMLVHPAFLADRWLVRLFHRVWFWLSLPVLVLFFVAISLRIEALGLTNTRLICLVGGIWAAVLTVIFLARRGDIRLMPALATIAILPLTLGPLNAGEFPVEQQAQRLAALLALPGKDGASFPPDWTKAQVEAAGAAADYLGSDPKRLAAIVEPYGIRVSGDSWISSDEVLRPLGYAEKAADGRASRVLFRSATSAVNLADTPVGLAHYYFYEGSEPSLGQRGNEEVGGVSLWLEDGALMVITTSGEPATKVDLSTWIDQQIGADIVDPWIDFTAGDRRFRFVVDRLEIDPRPILTYTAQSMEGMLFTSAPLTPTP